MGFAESVLYEITSHYENEMLTASMLLSMLAMVFILSAYEFLVYRIVLRRSLYNKAFNISVAVIPFFIAVIIITLQSNLVITLGTIGALAIIRFRTAIKDPVDMVFVLWSVFVGITCGCRLYEAAVLTSLVVTIVIFILNYASIGLNSHVLVVHCKENYSTNPYSTIGAGLRATENKDDKQNAAEVIVEDALISIISDCAKRYRIKSRNFSAKGLDYVIELSTKNPAELVGRLGGADFVEKFSLIEYDSEDVL